MGKMIIYWKYSNQYEISVRLHKNFHMFDFILQQYYFHNSNHILILPILPMITTYNNTTTNTCNTELISTVKSCKIDPF
jgi:hypothetical protein